MKITLICLFVLLALSSTWALALTNGSLEGPYTALTGSSSITGHIANGWGDSSTWSGSVMTYGCDTDNPHSGLSSQKITLSSNTTAQFVQGVTVTLGRTYAARVWMRASSPTTVTFQLRQAGSPYTAYLSNNSVALGTDWQQVTIAGPVSGSGTSACFFMIQLSSPATIWVDDASLDDITPSPQIVTNGDFEGSNFSAGTSGNITGVIGSGWQDNSAWSGAVINYSLDSTNPHGGAVSQKIAYSSGGPAQFIQFMNLTAGRIYHASVWLKASAPTTVQFSVREAGFPYTDYIFNDSLALTTSWTRVNLSGFTGGGGCFFLLQLNSPVTVWMDDASLTDITPPLPQSAVSDDFFGMHFALGYGSPALPWPSNYVGTWRLWDANVTWRQLQPNSSNAGSDPSTWDATTVAVLDSYVAAAQANKTTLVMTLGQTPDWATSYRGSAYYGAGAPGYPSNIQYWRDYLTGLGNRYKGKIHYWEIWNEPNDPMFWSGTTAQMVTLTQEANTILKGIDPSNQIISPSAVGDPTGFLTGYLATGGASYCDVIGYHPYVPTDPEGQVSFLNGIRDVMSEYGVYQPLWNTENGWTETNAYLTAALPDGVDADYVAQSYLLQWAFGLEGRSMWYRWENSSAMVLNLTAAGNNNSLTSAGIAHINIQRWLRGGTVMTGINCDSNGTWVISIARPYTDPGYCGYLIWNPRQTIASYPIPSAWGITNLRILNSGSTSYSSPTVYVAADPILLENHPPTSMVAHWALDESSGSRSLDSSGYYVTGYYQNGPTFATTVPSAIIFPNPGCLTFNGINQYVDMGNPVVLPSGTSPRTICGWGKASNTGGGYRWIAAYGSPNNSQAMFIGMNGTTLVGGGYGDDLSVPNFWDNNWHFIALTYDGATANLYADGTLVSSSARTWNLVLNMCYIGKQVNGSSEYWNGSIDDVRIYNRALTATEVSNLAAGNP